MKLVIDALSEKSQVFLTSHSPLFVRPNNLQNTIIVQGSKARCAERVSDIREVLGVRFSDNLQNARLVLIVEGRGDVDALSKIIMSRNDTIRMAVEEGLIAFDDLNGASSLSQKASFYRSSACEIQAFLDNDEEGRQAVRKAIEAKSVKVADVNLSVLPGRENSELEDLYDKNVYRDDFLEAFGVDVKRRLISKNLGKWSDILERNFIESGKPWTERQKIECKAWLSRYAAANPSTIIEARASASIDAFVTSVDLKIRKL